MSRVPKAILDGGHDTSSIDLSFAENCVIQDEVLNIYQQTMEKTLRTEHLSFPKGFWGDSRLLEILADFFNQRFSPSRLVSSSHITLAPGAAGCLDAALWNVCNPKDGVLVPGPYWNGNDVFFRLRASVTPILVPLPDLDAALGPALVPALETAFANTSCSIKALVLTNPHNPLGICYPKDTLEECLKFCQEKKIHFISDEVFGLTGFDCPDLPSAQPFVSALSLDTTAPSYDPSLVHVIWSPSKTFGLSGLRLGCTITQANVDMRNGLALAAHFNISTLSALLVAELLASSKLSSLMELNSERLSAAYRLFTSFLKRHDIPFRPCNMVPFILAKPDPHAKSWDDEAAVIQGLQDVGVIVGSGKSNHMPEEEQGWVKVNFALKNEVMEEAFTRAEKFLDSRAVVS